MSATPTFPDPAAAPVIDYDALALMLDSAGLGVGVSRHYPKQLMESQVGVADIVALLVAEHKRANNLEVKVLQMAAALDRLYPGWAYDGCLPDCKGACCDMG